MVTDILTRIYDKKVKSMSQSHNYDMMSQNDDSQLWQINETFS